MHSDKKKTGAEAGTDRLATAFVRRLVLGNVIVVLFVIALTTLSLYQSRQDHQAKIETAARNLTRVLEKSIAATIDKADISLQTVAIEVDRQNAHGGIDSAVLDRFLEQQQGLIDELASLRVSDAEGMVRFGLGIGNSTPVSIADRDYFQRARDNPKAGLIVAEPILSRLTNKWVLILARRLNHPDGSFAGIVSAGVPADHFQSLFAAMNLGSSGSVGLRTGELRLLARYPGGPAIDAAIGGNDVSETLRRALAANPREGTYFAKAPLDHVERTFSYSRIADFPLYILVGLGTAEHLADWRQEATKVSTLAALLILLVLGSSWLAYRGWRRQRQSDAALSRESQRSQLLLQTAIDGIHILDCDGKLVEVNKAFCDMLGYSWDELARMEIADLDSSVTAESFAANVHRFFSEGRVFETQHRRRDGRLLDVEVSATGIEFEGKRLIFCASREITRRKRAEQEQKRLRRALELLGDSSLALVHAASEQSLLPEICRLIVDKGGYRMAWVGFAESDPDRTVRCVARAGEGADYLEQVRISWADDEFGNGPVGTAIRTGRPQVIQDIDADPHMAPWREEADKRGYRSGLALPLAAEDKALGALAIYAGEPDTFGPEEVRLLEKLADNLAFGIAAHRTDAELARHRDHLEELVAQRTAELSAARQAAESANRAKSVFLANMSHEIRTPMNAILGLTHLLQRSERAPDVAEKLGKIGDAAHHLLSIINNILDLSKIEAGKLELEASGFTLAQVFGNVSTLLADKAATKGLAWEVDIDPALSAPCWGDALRLGQILVNFAANAVKFTERGAVSLRARRLAYDDHTVTVRCEVADTGIGIAPSVLPRLFQAFEQADGSTTRQYGGTGLGLAISRRLAELMDGEIGVDSTPGRGSTFWFTARLGLAGGGKDRAHAAVPSLDAAAILASDFRGARILIAEDEPINQEIAREFLEELGIVVDVADDGAAALAMARQADYDLILMDMQMPIMDGLAATRAIRLLPGHRHTPILAMTANAFQEDRQRCQEAGMDDHLAKPFDPDEFLATLLGWLRKSRTTVLADQD